MPGRGHELTIDSGWREVAETALALVAPHRTRARPQPGPGRGWERQPQVVAAVLSTVKLASSMTLTRLPSLRCTITS